MDSETTAWAGKQLESLLGYELGFDDVAGVCQCEHPDVTLSALGVPEAAVGQFVAALQQRKALFKKSGAPRQHGSGEVVARSAGKPTVPSGPEKAAGRDSKGVVTKVRSGEGCQPRSGVEASDEAGGKNVSDEESDSEEDARIEEARWNALKTAERPLTAACTCAGSVHEAYSNCVECGQVCCLEMIETLKRCSFCGTSIRTGHRGRKERQRMTKYKALDGFDKAMETTKSLHAHDSHMAKKTEIFDTDTDFYTEAHNPWLTKKQREEAKEKAQQESEYSSRSLLEKSILVLNFEEQQFEHVDASPNTLQKV